MSEVIERDERDERNTITYGDCENDSITSDPITYSQFHLFTAAGKAVWNSTTCPRCQQAVETTFHQLWECPHNEHIEGTHLEYLQEARDGHLLTPSFWLRGLPPLMWTYPHCMREPSGSFFFSAGRPSNPMDLPAGAIIGTDGSGGPHSAEPRLRRCGWATWRPSLQGRAPCGTLSRRYHFRSWRL